MSQRKLRLISSIVLVVGFAIVQVYNYYFPKKSVLSTTTQVQKVNAGVTVAKVVDGDTIDVLENGQKEKIRIIGINTPETVDPRRPVQCFGKEASNKAKEILTGQTVKLESDPTQTDKDKYGRLLRYVFLSNGTDFGLEMIKQGFAYEYTYAIPYKFQKEYKLAQKEAENLKRGLWGDGVCQ